MAPPSRFALNGDFPNVANIGSILAVSLATESGLSRFGGLRVLVESRNSLF
jgi:hypothetical protein